MQPVNIMHFVSSVFLMAAGVMAVVSSRILRREEEVCTESVTATLLEAQRFRSRTGYHYYYVLRYTWNGKTFEREYSAEETLGNVGDEAVIHINPEDPEQIRSTKAAKRSRYCLAAGVAMIVGGVIWLIVTLIRLIGAFRVG
ncbi:MAG: hypothetical protein K5695_02520 [Oscillospiraceae bacterium]|nr:hypothetical protein [Oscillospiraceae bacterium]